MANTALKLETTSALSNDATQHIIDQGYASYRDEDHQTWKTLFDRQIELLPGRAVPEFFTGMEKLQITNEGIPDFKEINKRLKPMTGWEICAVPGLIPDDPFFEMLANRVFPVGNFIRRPDQLDYIEEPDVFHDCFGHVPLLTDQVYADHMQAYGEGGLKAREHDAVKNLARLYWYTIEFGLMKTDEGLKIYGAGIVSSPQETVFALESDSPHRVAFDPLRVMQTDYIIDDLQQIYFAIDSFQHLFDVTDIDFAPLYAELKKADKDPLYKVEDIAESDQVITHGTQSYATAKKKAS